MSQTAHRPRAHRPRTQIAAPTDGKRFGQCGKIHSMAASTDTYTAWDGSRYAGQPPDGWYLAADNRWWPSQDLIRAGGATTEDEAAPDLTPEPPPQSPTPAEVRPPRSGASQLPPPQSPSWAPRRPVPKPTMPPRGGQGQTPRRSLRPKRKIRPDLLIPLILFALFRFGGAVFDNEGPTLQPIPTFPAEQPTATTGPPRSTPPSSVAPVFGSGDLQVVITGCGSGTITGVAQNLGSAPTEFATAITFEILDGLPGGPPIETIETTIGPLAAGGSEPFTVSFPEPDDVPACQVLDVAQTAS